MSFPLLFEVGHHVYTDSAVMDDYGELTPVFTPAKDAPGTSYKVFGWSVPSSREPAVAGHDRLVVDVQLLAPPDFPAGPYDLIDIPDLGQFQVIGLAEKNDANPFGWNPGMTVNLRKVSG